MNKQTILSKYFAPRPVASKEPAAKKVRKCEEGDDDVKAIESNKKSIIVEPGIIQI